MHRYSGRHAGRVPRLRVALVLALCASSLSAIVAGPATAAPALTVAFLGDLNSGTNSSSPQPDYWATGIGGVQASADNDFFIATSSGQPDTTHVYVSKGVPGGVTVVDPPAYTGGASGFSYLLGLGDGSALFGALSGPALEGAFRIFFSDGTTGGSCAVQPNGACTNGTYAGLYMPIEDYPPIARAEDGAVFLAAPVTTSMAGPVVGDLVPWHLARTGGVLTVTSLVAGFGYDGAGGFPLTGVGKAMAGVQSGLYPHTIVATAGSTLFADLLDCDPQSDSNAPQFCVSSDQGDELYALDLAAAEPSWVLVDGGMSVGSQSTVFGYAVGVVDGSLFFTARPDAGPDFNLYVTDGISISEVTVPDGSDDFLSSLSAQLLRTASISSYPDSYLYFASATNPDELWRASTSGGDAEFVRRCTGADIDGPRDLAVVGTTLYFPCNEEVLIDDVSYDTGVELFRITDAGNATVSPGNIVYDFNAGSTGSAVYPADDGIGLLDDAAADGLGPQFTEFEGSLFFRAANPAVQVYPSQLELYHLDSEGIPEIAWQRLPNSSSVIQTISAAGGRLYFWANAEASGLFAGSEPWVASVPKSTLSVVVSGEGQVTSDPFGISCVAPPTGEDVCARDFDAGTEVTLSAYEDLESGYTFSGWSPNCTPVQGEPSVCAVSMSQARTVTAFFVASGDSLALAGSAPDAVGAGALVPFRLDVRNVQPGGDPLSVSIGVTTSLVLATAGCTTSATFDAECVVPPIPSGETRSLLVYAYAPDSGAADAGFELILPSAVAQSDDLTNNSASLSVPVESDVLSLLLTSYPVTATEGSPVTYGLRLTNGTASTTATGVALRAGFDRSVTFAATPGCAVDTSGSSGYVTLVTCTLTDLAPAGSPRAIALGVVAPATGGVDLRAEFRVTYTQSGGTLTANDIAGPVVTTIEAPAAGELASTTQSFDAPTTVDTSLATLPPGGGLTTTDQSGAGVLLPGGFLGSASVADLEETPLVAPATSLRLGILAKPSPGTSGAFQCVAMRTYDAECLAFRVTIDQAFDVRFVYTFTFRFDESAFRDGAGALLRIRNVSFFHDDGSGSGYVLIPACPRKATAATYTGSGPCLQSKRADRATGDYIFVILTDTNGNWKPGR